MTAWAQVPIGDPIAVDDDGVPQLYGALGAEFYLEWITEEDVSRLDEVNDLVWDWFGGALKQTWFTCYEGPVATQRKDLDFVSGFARDVEKPKMPAGLDPEAVVVAHDWWRFSRWAYGVMCNGGAEPSHSSPYSYRFWAETNEIGPDPDTYRPLAVVNLTVPTSWPLEDFYSRVLAIGSKLRVRWGLAGLTYSPWELCDPWPGRDALFAHARRHIGYDAAAYVRVMEPWRDQIRGVSWLTLLGPAFVAKALQRKIPLVSTEDLDISQSDGIVVVRAGSQPVAGDRNRLQIPHAYQSADRLLRPLRSGGGVDFALPWTAESTTDWLRRFEKRYF